jgi:hypothetical protein
MIWGILIIKKGTEKFIYLAFTDIQIYISPSFPKHY